MSYELMEARELVIKAGLTLVENGLIARTWGNISARISDKQFVITPSGRDYHSLIPEDIVVVNIKDCSYEGEIKPSGEVATHAEVYRQKPDVNFVVHTHQVYASAISIMGEDVSDSDILGDSITCAKYARCCTDALAKNVKNAIRKNPNSKALFLRNHGIISMGCDFDEAFKIADQVEEICKSKYEFLCQNFISSADTTIEADFGTSHRENGYIYLSVGNQNISWPLGYAKKAHKEDVPKSLRGLAILHDIIYSDSDINYISHVVCPNITIMSKLSHGKLKSGFRPYIDDQAQIAGVDIKKIALNPKRVGFLNERRIKKAVPDHGAFLVSTGGAICFGSTSDDIDALSSVLEKGCIAAIIAVLIPAIKPLPRKVARHMRDIYRDSYSKLKDNAMTATTLKEIEAKINQ